MDPILQEDPKVPEIQPTPPEAPPSLVAPEASLPPEPAPISPQPWETRTLLLILLGPQGLRAGWSVLLFVILLALFGSAAGFALVRLHLLDPKAHFTATAALFGE